MALNNLGLGVTFTARDAMSGTLYRLQRAFSGLEIQSKSAVQAIGGGFASMAGGVALVTAGLAGFEASLALAGKAGKFEGEMMRVKQISGATDEQMVTLTASTLDMSDKFGRSTSEVSKGMGEIAALGFSATETLNMMNPSLNLATAGNISLAESAEAMGSAMKVFSIEATPENMARTASSLLGIANKTALQADDLRIALGTVGRGASIAKQDLNEVLIMMGLVKNTGVDATVAASSVSSAMLYMAENAKKFKKIGIDVEDSSGRIRKVGDVFLDLQAKLAKNPSMAKNVSIVKDLLQRFGITAYSGITEQLTQAGIKDDKTGQILKGADALNYLRASMKDFQDKDYAKTVAENLLGTFDALSTQLPNTFENLQIELGRGFKELFAEPLKLLVDGMKELRELMSQIPAPMKRLFAGLMVGASIFTVVAGMALITAGAITVLSTVAAFAGTTLFAMFTSVLAWAVPILVVTGLLTAAFTAFGAGLYFIFSKNIGGAADSLAAFYKKWKMIFESVVGFLAEGKLSGALADEFNLLDQETKDKIVSFTLFFTKIKEGFLAMVDTMSVLLEEKGLPVLKKLGEAFMGVASALGLSTGSYEDFTASFTKADAQARGQMLGKFLVDTFLDVAQTMVIVLGVVEKLINAFSFLWKFKFALLGAKLGTVAGPWGMLAGAIAGGGADLYNYASEDTPTAQDPASVALAAKIAEMKAKQSLADGPAVAAAALAGEDAYSTQEGFDALSQQRGVQPPVEVTVHNVTQLDGQVLSDSVQKVRTDENNSSFSADAAWSY